MTIEAVIEEIGVTIQPITNNVEVSITSTTTVIDVTISAVAEAQIPFSVEQRISNLEGAASISSSNMLQYGDPDFDFEQEFLTLITF